MYNGMKYSYKLEPHETRRLSHLISPDPHFLRLIAGVLSGMLRVYAARALERQTLD